MTERWIALSGALGQWVWLWPFGAIGAAVLLRLIEHSLIESAKAGEYELTRSGRLLLEA